MPIGHHRQQRQTCDDAKKQAIKLREIGYIPFEPLSRHSMQQHAMDHAELRGQEHVDSQAAAELRGADPQRNGTSAKTSARNSACVSTPAAVPKVRCIPALCRLSFVKLLSDLTPCATGSASARPC